MSSNATVNFLPLNVLQLLGFKDQVHRAILTEKSKMIAELTAIENKKNELTALHKTLLASAAKYDIAAYSAVVREAYDRGLLPTLPAELVPPALVAPTDAPAEAVQTDPLAEPSTAGPETESAVPEPASSPSVDLEPEPDVTPVPKASRKTSARKGRK